MNKESQRSHIADLEYPIVVDLDGTLIFSDMLHESTLGILREMPTYLLRIPFWLFHGKANLKKQLAGHVEFDEKLLPYNFELIEWLKQQKSRGRKLILCTASNQVVASKISGYLGIFDEVLASDGRNNLAGKQKAEVLVNRFGEAGFDYVANSSADISVWKCSRRGILVNAPANVEQRARQHCEVEKVFSMNKLKFATWRRVLRVHQWLKNLLLFVPLLAAHQVTNVSAWLNLILAFGAFSLCASSVYVANDLLDLESDRQHPRKRNRPFASGLMTIRMGVGLVPFLMAAALILAHYVSGSFLIWMLFYFALTCAYSWGLKRLALVDCLTLAMLYTLRIVAGAAAVSVSLSFWLLAFSVFLFLSLAFVKRYAELHSNQAEGKHKVHGRGYYVSDAPLVQALGITSGYVSVLVLALYLNSENVTKLYQTPELIWAAVPPMLLWISWIWMQAHRGLMHDDPIIFAIKDKASIVMGLFFMAAFILAQLW